MEQQKDKLINRISDVLKEHDYIDFAALFGSFASEAQTSLSDVDIGIHASKDIPLIELGSLNTKIENIARKNVDIVILNDLYKTNPFFVREIISKGSLLFAKNRAVFIEYRRNAMLYYLDMKHLKIETDRRLIKRIESGRFAERNYA